MKNCCYCIFGKYGLLVLFFCVSWSALQAQTAQMGYVIKRTDGSWLVPAEVTASGDTVAHVELREFTISAPRSYLSADDAARYNKYRRLAPSVYPYAVEAVRMYRLMEAATRDKARKDRKAYIASLEQELDEKFRSKMKNLSRTQGLLLIKMIEKEIHMPFYDLIKDINGGFSAWKWNQFGKIYGYRLSEGYEYGKDAVMDAVLRDYNLMYAAQ